MSEAKRAGTFRLVWRWPLVLALVSTLGLVAALIGDGVWDVVSWLALAAPVVISSTAWLRSRR